MYSDYINGFVKSKSEIINENVIRDIIKADTASELKNNMYFGELYYRSRNYEICNRNFEYTNSAGELATDAYKANNKIANGFFKLLVDQKVNYSCSKPIIIENADNITSIVNVNDFIPNMVKESSKKSVAWLHTYVNKNGEFKYIIIPSEEIYPVYDTEFENDLLQVIRYYTIKVVQGNEEANRYKVEIWDKEKTTYYMQDEKGNFYLDTSIENNPQYYFNSEIVVMGQVKEKISHGWGKVPFIPLWNNLEKETDLNPIKTHIDMYDKCQSDFANNLEDLQDSIIKLIGYVGESENLGKFRDNLKRYKVIPLDNSGNAEYMSLDIPIEARKELLKELRSNIFEFGQGVDVTQIGDGNITNVVIKNRYAALDLKANETEKNVKEFLNQFFEFVNIYLKLNNKKQDDISKINIIFNRSVIININELVDMCQKSKGIVSDKTIISNHPWIDSLEEELKNIEEENKIYLENNMDNEIIDKNGSSKSADNQEKMEKGV